MAWNPSCALFWKTQPGDRVISIVQPVLSAVAVCVKASAFPIRGDVVRVLANTQIRRSRIRTSRQPLELDSTAMNKIPSSTEAISKPNPLCHSATLITYCTSLNVPSLRSLEGLVGHRVLFVEQKLDRRKVAALLVIQLLLSSPSDVDVGLLAYRSDVGIAVTAGIIALTGFLQG